MCPPDNIDGAPLLVTLLLPALLLRLLGVLASFHGVNSGSAYS